MTRARRSSARLQVVFDTSTVISAVLFAGRRLAWLREHWSAGACTPLVSAATAAELTRVLAYPKFALGVKDRHELLAEYLPSCAVVEHVRRCPHTCRDANDQMFLDVAHSAKAAVLVSSDRDLLALAGERAFAIETPEAYRVRVGK